MSPDPDRIPVPTNGRGPHTDMEATEAATDATEAATEAATGTASSAAGVIDYEEDDLDEPTDAEFAVAFTPKQVAVGFAILASLILLLGVRRRRQGASDDD
jgi:hypothetical protein